MEKGEKKSYELKEKGSGKVRDDLVTGCSGVNFTECVTDLDLQSKIVSYFCLTFDHL